MAKEGQAERTPIHRIHGAVLSKALAMDIETIRLTPGESHSAYHLISAKQDPLRIKFPRQFHEQMVAQFKTIVSGKQAEESEQGERMLRIGRHECRLGFLQQQSLHGLALEITLKRIVAPLEEAEPDKAEIKVLLVEDSPTLRNYFAFILRRSFTVIEAETAEEGLKLMSRHHPDMLITDQELPGMNGTELIAGLRNMEEHKHMLTMLMTANDIELEALNGGADGFIAKPVKPDMLLARIRALLAVATRRSTVGLQ